MLGADQRHHVVSDSRKHVGEPVGEKQPQADRVGPRVEQCSELGRRVLRSTGHGELLNPAVAHRERLSGGKLVNPISDLARVQRTPD